MAAFREAVSLVPGGNPYAPGVGLGNPATAYHARYERTGNPADLAAAITAGREAVAAAPPGSEDYARSRTFLGNALHAKFEWEGNVADLAAAVGYGREAVAATPPGQWSRVVRVANLSVALRTSFDLTGNDEDLADAITYGREAVDAYPRGHPDRIGRTGRPGSAFPACQGKPPAHRA